MELVSNINDKVKHQRILRLGAGAKKCNSSLMLFKTNLKNIFNDRCRISISSQVDFICTEDLVPLNYWNQKQQEQLKGTQPWRIFF